MEMNMNIAKDRKVIPDPPFDCDVILEVKKYRKEGWPCIRESFSEVNRQSRNFQHSRFLLSPINRQAQKKGQEKNSLQNDGFLVSQIHSFLVFGTFL